MLHRLRFAIPYCIPWIRWMNVERGLVRQRQTPTDLEQGLQQSWDWMTIDQLEFTFKSLKELDGYPSTSLLDKLSEKTMELRDGLTGRNVASIFSTISRLKYYNSELFNELAQEMLKEAKIEDLRGYYCAMMIYSLGVLQQSYVKSKPIEERENAFYFPLQIDLIEALIQRMIKIKDEVKQSNTNIANCIYGLATLNYKHDFLLRILVEEALRFDRVESFNEQEISNMIYSFGLLNFRPSHLLSNFCLILHRSEALRKWTEQGLSNVVYGFGLLQYRPPKETMYALLWEISRDHRLQRFEPQHLMNIIHGLVGLKVKNYRVYKSLINELISRKSDSNLIKIGLSSVVYSLSRIGIYFDGIKQFYEVLTSEMNITELTDQALTNLITSLGKFNEVEELFVYLEKLVSEANFGRRLNRLTTRQLTQILLGLSNSLLTSQLKPQSFEALIHRVTQIEVLQNCSNQDLANLVCALTRLNYHEKGMHDSICLEVCQRVRSLEGIALSTFVYSWSLIPYKNHSFLVAVETRLSQGVIHGYSERVLGNLLFGLMRLDFQNVQILQKILMRIREPDIWDRFVYFTSPQRLEELLNVDWLDPTLRSTLETNLKIIRSQKRNISM